jgi:phosphatidate cytidylyltransferase
VHLRRWLTALVLIPFLVLVLLKMGRLAFVLVLLLINALGQWEFLGMFQPGADAPRRLKALILGSLLLLSFCTAERPGYICNPSGPIFVLVLVFAVLLLFYLASYGHIADLGRDLMVNTLGLLYLPFLLGHFIWLRYLPQGEWWVLWLMAVIFAGDTAAFYCGQAFGKKKLCPQVSPGKTWAGVVGGLTASLVVGVAAGKWLLPGVGGAALAALAVVLGVMGLLGDLFESMLKRQAQVKDASHLLPGHGGMLDRLDSLLFAAPAMVYVRLFFFSW